MEETAVLMGQKINPGKKGYICPACGYTLIRDGNYCSNSVKNI